MGIIKRKDAIKNKYSFIKRIDGKLSLVDKDYNILIHDVVVQPDLFDWIEKNNLWNHPNGILESEKYQQIRNPEGIKTIHDAFNWAGNVTGGALAGIALAPYLPVASNFLIKNAGKSALQTLGKMFDPTNYIGAGVTSYFGADALNNFTNNPNLENGIQVGLSLSPLLFKGFQFGKQLVSKFNPTVSLKPSIIDPRVYKEATSIGTQFYPNQKDIFKYNGYLDSHFYSDGAKQIVDQFGDNIKQLQESLKTLEESDKVYVRNFLKSKAFANNNVPYYTSHRELLADHPKIKAALDEQPEIKRRFQNDIDNVVIDIGDDFGVLVKEPDQITHEFTHVLQKKKDYLPEQKDLLNKAYIHSKDSTLPTGKIDEKGAVNQQLRTLLINEYKDSYGRYPEVQELQDYIDAYPDHALKNLLENYTNLYGQEYVNNNSNIKLVKKALKWVGATLPFTTLDSNK